MRYEEGDFFPWHQHASDKAFTDQSVYIVSTGAERMFAVKPIGGKLTKILAQAGSLIVLPTEYNTTHLHCVPRDKNCHAPDMTSELPVIRDE